VLYVDPELEEHLASVDCEHKFVLGNDDDLFSEGVEPQPWEHDGNATATINYTSGTTARPKGVQITHRNIWTNAITFALHAGVTDRDVFLHTLPMFHANGWGMPFAMTGMGVQHIVLARSTAPRSSPHPDVAEVAEAEAIADEVIRLQRAGVPLREMPPAMPSSAFGGEPLERALHLGLAAQDRGSALPGLSPRSHDRWCDGDDAVDSIDDALEAGTAGRWRCWPTRSTTSPTR
jgi:non-ribosomal peptide synthetase component F